MERKITWEEAGIAYKMFAGSSGDLVMDFMKAVNKAMNPPPKLKFCKNCGQEVELKEGGFSVLEHLNSGPNGRSSMYCNWRVAELE
jgi:hypothetical protein